MYQVLTDLDVEKSKTMKSAVAAIHQALLEQAGGTLVAPPRFHLSAPKGGLAFTTGALTGPSQVMGFRVYDTNRNQLEGHEQVVCVFDSDTGVFKGIIIGNLLGPLRTGAIGGAAIETLAREDARVVGVIGSGEQARTQLEAAVAVREIHQVYVYSQNANHRSQFAAEMTEKLGVVVTPMESAQAVVERADILICATNSSTPVLEASWLKAGVHINAIGPKAADAHELPLEVVDQSSVIATDSMEQVQADATPSFLVGTKHASRMVQLSDIVAGAIPGRQSANDITLFWSVGLAGTEVVVANEIFKRTLNSGLDGCI